MFLRLSILFLVNLAILVRPEESELSEGRHRQCCMYSYGTNDTVCSDRYGCILEGSSIQEESPSTDQCRVLYDSKSENLPKNDCLSSFSMEDTSLELNAWKDYAENDGDKFVLPIRIAPYNLSMAGAKLLPAIEVRLDYNFPWRRARFRITNTDICDPITDFCSPRCVEIDRPWSDELGTESQELIYDCEVGFYPKDSLTMTTSGTTYQIDVCMDLGKEKLCGHYLFRMPHAGEKEGDLVLLDKKALLHDKAISLYFPKALESSGRIGFMKVDADEENRTLMETFRVPSGVTFVSLQIGRQVEEGIYEVAFLTGDETYEVIATFTLSHYNYTVKSTSVLIIILLILFTLTSVLGYFQYLYVKKFHKVEPNKLVESGQVPSRKVYIVTNVENRQHVEIVQEFNKYLKNHCGVSEIYFALDPKTGISTQAEGDPWKWAQETASKVAGEGGYIIFIGSPPQNMGLDIYKNLSDNQAFVSTSILKEMSEKQHVSVVMFSYCEESTLPAMLPDHLKEQKLVIPKEMNTLLCRMLGVQKRPLFPCIPLRFIQPEVCCGNMAKFYDGKDLLQRIEKLTEKVESFKTQSDLLYNINGDESIPLRYEGGFVEESDLDKQLTQVSKSKSEEPSLSVNIESNTVGLADSRFKDREKFGTTEG